jgi:hypothetical protein
LALRRGNLPPQRSPQPPHLGFAAFDHLFPRIRWRSESHLGKQKQPAVPAAYLKNPPIQAVMEVVLDAGLAILTLSDPQRQLQRTPELRAVIDWR